MKRILLLQSLLITTIAFSQTQPKNYNTLVEQELKKVIDWRRDIHQNPELSNREFKTQV
jgi:amidohydrolase